MGGKSIGKEKLKIGDVIPRAYDEKIKSAEKRYQNGIAGVADETEANSASNEIENGEVNGSASRGKSVRDAVTPLAHLPYAEQLEQKKNSLTQILKRLVSCFASFFKTNLYVYILCCFIHFKIVKFSTMKN